MKAKLYRSRTDSMIGGVCGGLAEYFGIDPTLVRLGFVVAVATGVSLLVYPVLWVIIPREGRETLSPTETVEAGVGEMAQQARDLGSSFRGDLKGTNSHRGSILGGILILVGVMALVQTLNLYWLRWLNFGLLWPVLLIALGVLLIQRRTKTA